MVKLALSIDEMSTLAVGLLFRLGIGNMACDVAQSDLRPALWKFLPVDHSAARLLTVPSTTAMRLRSV